MTHHTGIVITQTADVFTAARRTQSPLRTLAEGCVVRVTSRGPKWLGVEDADGPGHVEAMCIGLADPDGRGFLAGDVALLGGAVEAADADRLAASSGAQGAAVARAWNLYGGLVQTLSARMGIDPAVAIAVLCVESAGQGFGPDGRVVIRFENHIFHRYLVAARGASGETAFKRHFQVSGAQPWLGHAFRTAPNQPWTAFHGSQALEWRAYELARSLDEDAATRSISMGLPQVMGFNHALVGYATPRSLLVFMGADVRYQLLALFDFIAGARGEGRALAALRRGDFDGFATLYNGPGQARYYGELIASHVQAFRRLKPAPASSSTVSSTSAKTQHAPAAGGRQYQVRAGDTLGVIAGRFGVPLRDLAQVNGIANPDRIFVGQVLVIPSAEPPPPPIAVPSTPPDDLVEADVAASEAPVTPTSFPYVVQPGDTLGAIAKRAGSTAAVLAEANGIANPNLIFPGQVIHTPRAIG